MFSIYIVTTYTGTALSYLIRNIGKVEYAHVSISLNQELRPMYSFGRLNPKTPIFAGFVQENINEGLYAIKKNTICRVYSLDVSELSYNLMKEALDGMWQEKDSYDYDVLALVRMSVGRDKGRNNKYVCSTFVADILDRGKVNLFDKEYYQVKPNDFLKSDRLRLEYEGLLSEYKVTSLNKGIIA